MSRQREYISSFWICDYCGGFQEAKDYGFRKDKYCLCKKCKNMSLDSIKRKWGNNFNGFNS